ncbi:MAG TPA: ABC transporter substrate-binding protein [Acidimicrobiales bacterium]|nr:ABC transporter substrate-binding protein [Acidimicrobiales bacterium]
MLVALVLLVGACGDSGDDTDNAAGDNDSTATTAADGEGTCSTFSGSDALTVGGTNFSEQEIVAEIYAQCLEAAGFKVDTKLKIGSREIVLPALEKGDIDLYPEYVGTLLTFLKGTPTSDVDKTVADLQAALKAKNLQVLEPAEAEDKNGFAVTKATADRLKLRTLSDLKGKASDLVFGAGPECDQRPLCLVGLKDTYGLGFKEVKKLDSGGPLTKDALEKGDIDVGLIFTSDGAVAARGFVVLEDDKNLQPPDNVVPIVRTDVVKGDLEELLNSISAKLTTEGLSALNKQVDIDKADPADVAKTWLQENGFIAE